jgi:hypothetical protein
MRSIHATILGAALLGSASFVTAQTPSVAAANLPKQVYVRNQSFDLPVKMEQDHRATLSEIRLYVKTPTTGWRLQESIAPHQTRFACKTTQDGEYWYTLATVDRTGRMTPADPSAEPPSQRVIVDTTAPVIQVQPWNHPDGDFCLRCTIYETNPDMASLKAVCKTEFGEIPLPGVANQPGVFRVKGSEPMRFPVIISMKDLAGNLGTKEVNVAEMVRTTLNTASVKTAPEVAQVSNQPASNSLSALPPPRFESTPPPLPNTQVPVRAEAPAPQKAPEAVSTVNRVDFPVPPPPINPPAMPISSAAVTNPTTPIISPVVNNPAPTINPSASYSVPVAVAPPTANVTTTKLPTILPEATNRGSAPYQLINTTHASVEYRIDQVGPSGVGKVEIFQTPDKGQTWHRVADHSGKRSPAEIDLPGDGEYGIRIVITNGNGFGGKAPVRGDTPHCTIEVDTTSPFVQLRSSEVLPTSGHVELRWNAQDKNLATEPVSLFYRTKTDGPWQVIARGVKNDGVHRWAFPRDAGAQFFFKIEVTDQAGNMSQDVSRQPVVIDMAEPRATVVGVTGGSVTRTPQ